MVVASRYVPGARARMSVPRRIASRAVNAAFSRGLSLPVTDLSSAFRLYHGDVLRDQRLSADDYDVLPESLVRALAGGWTGARDSAARRSGAARPLDQPARQPGRQLRPHLRVAVAAAQLDPGRRLRRARARQHHPAAALLAAPALQAHHRAHRRAGRRARRRLRVQQDHRRAAARQRGARHPPQQAALLAALRQAARPRLRLHAAVRRRVVPVRAVARR